MPKYLKMISPFNNGDEMPKPLFVIKKLLAFVFIYAVSSVMCGAVTVIAHFMAGLDPFAGETFPQQTTLLLTYYGYLIFLAVTLLYCRFVEGREAASLGFNKKISGYLSGALLAAALLAAIIGSLMLNGNIVYNGVIRDINIPVTLAFFGAFIVQGTMEEAMCRGFLMISLAKKISLRASVGVSTAVFMLPHFGVLFEDGLRYGIVGTFNLMIISIIFSALMLAGKNIWIACALHSFWNFLLFNIVGLNVSGVDSQPAVFNFSPYPAGNLFNGGNYGIEASVVTAFVLTVFTALLVFWVKREKLDASFNGLK